MKVHIADIDATSTSDRRIVNIKYARSTTMIVSVMYVKNATIPHTDDTMAHATVLIAAAVP